MEYIKREVDLAEEIHNKEDGVGNNSNGSKESLTSTKSTSDILIKIKEYWYLIFLMYWNHHLQKYIRWEFVRCDNVVIECMLP